MLSDALVGPAPLSLGLLRPTVRNRCRTWFVVSTMLAAPVPKLTDGHVLVVEANGAEPEEQPALPGVAGNPKAMSSIYDDLGVALPQGLSE